MASIADQRSGDVSLALVLLLHMLMCLAVAGYIARGAKA
jgi:hypothetical protein